MEKLFSLIRNVHTASGTHLASYSKFTEVPSPKEKRPVSEIDHSRQFIPEVKNEWSYTLYVLRALAGTTYLYLNNILNIKSNSMDSW